MIKNDLKNILSKQFFVGFTYLIFGLFLVLKKISPIYLLFCLAFMQFYSYFIHVLFHTIPYIREVHIIHHEKKIISKKLDLLFETILNFCFFGILYFIQELTGIKIIPTKIIIYAGLVYTSSHIINYSILNVNDIHEKHHLKEDGIYKYNFGPNIVDYVMGTNYHNDCEDLRHMYPNIILSYFFTELISRFF